MAGLVILSALGLLLVEADPWGSAASREYALNAQAQRVRGDLAAASTLYLAGLREAAASGNGAGQIRFLNSLGGCSYLQYQYRDALGYWLRARRLAETLPQEAEEHGAILFNLASLYYSSANREAAEAAALEGQERQKTLRKVPYYATRLHLIQAVISAARNRPPGETMQHYEAAVDAADRSGDDAALALVFNHIGTTYLASPDWNEAERYFLSAFRIRMLRKDPDLVYTYVGLAMLELARGNLAFATRLVDAAQRLAESTDRPVARHQIQEVRARILAGQRRFREAHTEYMGAIANIRRTRADLLPADLFRVNNQASLSGLYDSMLRNAMDWQRSGGAPVSLAAEAWFASEEWKASVASRPDADRILLQAKLDPEYWQTLAEVRQLERRSMGSGTSPASSPTNKGEQRLDRLRVRLAEMESYAGIRPFSHVFHENFTTPKPLILFRDSLGHDSVLISFHVGPKVAVRWTLSRDRLEWKELPAPARALEDLTAAFSEAVHSGPEGDRVRLSRELYGNVFGGLSPDALRASNWLLAFDGPLMRLPVSALSGGEAESGGAERYLIESRSLQLVTGAYALLARETGDWNGAFVGVGDAVYNTADPRWSNSSVRRPGGTLWGSLIAAEGRSRLGEAGGGMQLPRLASSREELEASANAWGGSGVRLLLGADANRRNTVESIEAGAAVVHFATHFVRREASPERALLVLSLDSNGQPDFFSPSDTVHVKTPDSLVVLSGCHSAAGSQIPAAGLMGMTRAWLTAGARGVIASLWPTPDDTGAIFQTFYRELQREAPSAGTDGTNSRQTSARQRGMTLRNAAEALRRAQLEMLRTQTWRALPKYWGTYLLIGRTT
jgi:CHAT domain-containing protein